MGTMHAVHAPSMRPLRATFTLGPAPEDTHYMLHHVVRPGRGLPTPHLHHRTVSGRISPADITGLRSLNQSLHT
jgi:hypothetical protein